MECVIILRPWFGDTFFWGGLENSVAGRMGIAGSDGMLRLRVVRRDGRMKSVRRYKRVRVARRGWMVRGLGGN